MYVYRRVSMNAGVRLGELQLRKVLTSLAMILSVVFAVTGAGNQQFRILHVSAGQNNRYAQSAGSNIHDSYYTLDILGLIRVQGAPDLRIGWTLIALS